jgi:hypothetical protein
MILISVGSYERMISASDQRIEDVCSRFLEPFLKRAVVGYLDDTHGMAGVAEREGSNAAVVLYRLSCFRPAETGNLFGIVCHPGKACQCQGYVEDPPQS